MIGSLASGWRQVASGYVRMRQDGVSKTSGWQRDGIRDHQYSVKMTSG